MYTVFITFLMVTFSCFQTIQGGTRVIEYSDADFSTNMGKHNLSLVLFYTPWCPHCKIVQPIFEETAGSLGTCYPPITLVKVNCEENTKTCEGYNVQKYPTFKLLAMGFEVQDYRGARNKDSMVGYMKSHAIDCYDENVDFEDEQGLEEILDKLLALSNKNNSEF